MSNVTLKNTKAELFAEVERLHAVLATAYHNNEVQAAHLAEAVQRAAALERQLALAQHVVDAQSVVVERQRDVIAEDKRTMQVVSRNVKGNVPPEAAARLAIIDRAAALSREHGARVWFDGPSREFRMKRADGALQVLEVAA